MSEIKPAYKTIHQVGLPGQAVHSTGNGVVIPPALMDRVKAHAQSAQRAHAEQERAKAVYTAALEEYKTALADLANSLRNETGALAAESLEVSDHTTDSTLMQGLAAANILEFAVAGMEIKNQ